ncbi:MAG: zinc ribbon domain-containing protein, partial [Eggerthellaceae bacterium]|nr:zinc ribbon domain-containing protein [Eggerthellaceae bacterium]
MANFCTNCGHKLNPNDRFCTQCGQPVIDAGKYGEGDQAVGKTGFAAGQNDSDTQNAREYYEVFSPVQNADTAGLHHDRPYAPHKT